MQKTFDRRTKKNKLCVSSKYGNLALNQCNTGKQSTESYNSNFLYMIAQFQTKSVYGNDLIYPVNDTAKKLVQLTGRKTVDKIQLKMMESLGFTLEFVALSPL